MRARAHVPGRRTRAAIRWAACCSASSATGTRQTNWAARNSSFLERDSDAMLKGFDDRQRVVDVVNPRTGAHERTIKRDYRELLPLVRHGFGSRRSGVATLLDPAARPAIVPSMRGCRCGWRPRCGPASSAAAITRGAAVVIDVDSGEVLASVSYPWPAPRRRRDVGRRCRPGRRAMRCSTARATGCIRPAPRSSCWSPARRCAAVRRVPSQTFACVRLPDGRVGNFVRGSTRPVRDDPMDTAPHGNVDLRHGLVVSCNAYFAQLAMRLGPQPIARCGVDVPDRRRAAGHRRRAAAHAAARRLRPGRRAGLAAEDGARRRGRSPIAASSCRCSGR